MRVHEILNTALVLEDVNGDYLYHSVQDADTAKAILSSGRFIGNQSAKQPASDAQTKLPVVSFSRNLKYALAGGDVGRDYVLVFVVDRARLEQRYRTLGTSQSQNTTGLAYGGDTEWLNKSRDNKGIIRQLDINNDGKIDRSEVEAGAERGVLAGQNMKKHLYRSKAGKEFEEIVPTKSGSVPLKGLLVGFYIIPGKGLENDPELANHPLRLDMPRPNTFVKHNPRQLSSQQ